MTSTTANKLNWEEKRLGEVLVLNYGWSLPEKKRVPGSVPVFGSNGVVGTHNEAFVSSHGIVVGRKGSAGNVHFSPKPFCPIDTTFFVAPSDTALEIEFLYYLLLHVDLTRILGDVGVPGLNREMAYREEVYFPRDKNEQRRIAAVLRLVQRSIEQQKRLMALTAELKKSLLHQLFTRGLRNEPQKQTELGPLPDSWRIMRADDVCNEITVGIVVRPSSYYVEDGIPALRSQNVRRDKIQEEPMVFISKEAHQEKLAKSRINTGDVLVVRTGANLGMSCDVPEKFDNSNCIDLVIMRPNRDLVHGGFISRFINSTAAQSQIHGGKVGLAQQHYNVGIAKQTIIPLPSLEEQQRIISVLKTIDLKTELHRRKQTALTALFRTLLHQLMTAKIRVHDLDLSELESTLKK